jgi:hypothetical protein
MRYRNGKAYSKMNIRLIRKSLYTVLMICALALSFAVVHTPQAVNAANEPCAADEHVNAADGRCVCPDGYQQVTVAVSTDGKHCIPINPDSGDLRDNPIYYYLKNILKFLSAGVGLAVVGGIVFGGYMYITARANAGQVEKAKVVIINSVIGLLLFIFMFSILQFLIPGGIFG